MAAGVVTQGAVGISNYDNLVGPCTLRVNIVIMNHNPVLLFLVDIICLSAPLVRPALLVDI